MHTKNLLLMITLHFLAMYILMYSMVNALSNVYPNLNNAYMAAVMTAPMLLIEVILMGHMYKDKKSLKVAGVIGLMVLVFSFLFIRQQTFITDKEFIRSMIPHHSGAILMCEKSSIVEEDLKRLCQDIISNQQAEIDQMKNILSRLN